MSSVNGNLNFRATGHETPSTLGERGPQVGPAQIQALELHDGRVISPYTKVAEEVDPTKILEGRALAPSGTALEDGRVVSPSEDVIVRAKLEDGRVITPYAEEVATADPANVLG